MFETAAVSDLCLVVEDLGRSLSFYRDTLGIRLRRLAPGFADFANGGSTLALWERAHLLEHVGIDSPPHGDAYGRSIVAVQVETAGEIDRMHGEFKGRGVRFVAAPKWYPWNAYATYFEDPDHHLWEIYAWGEGGHANLLEGPA